MKLNLIKKGFKNLWSNSLQESENDEPLIPTKNGGTCLQRINMSKKEAYSFSLFYGRLVLY